MSLHILHVVQAYWPSVGGMQEVVRQLSERLVRAGHRVTVVCSAHPQRQAFTHNGVALVAFDVQGLPIRGLTGDVAAYQDFLKNSSFDIVTFFAAQHWATDLALPMLDQIKGKKVFVPTGFSGLYNPAYASYYEKMQTWMKQFDSNVFLSDDYRDINFARKHGITKNILIPNGAAADEFSRTDLPNIRSTINLPQNAKLLLHVGSFTGFKGQELAVKIFAQAQDENLKQARLLLVGDDSEKFMKKLFSGFSGWQLRRKLKRMQKEVVAKSLSRDETLAAYHAADLFLFPSWIECSPVVLFECMASQTPFLVSDVGNAKEIIAWSNAGALLPTTIDKHGYSHAQIEPSAKLLDAWMNDDAKRQEAAKKGFDVWQQKFTWEHIASQYESLYKQLHNTPSA
ncbi:MAG: glycosyltransferase family 4 protein [Bacteroidia bacterium]